MCQNRAGKVHMQVALQLVALQSTPVPLLQPHCRERAQISAYSLEKNAIWVKAQLPRVLYSCLLVEREQNFDHCTVFPQFYWSSNTDVLQLQGLTYSSCELTRMVAFLFHLCFPVLLWSCSIFQLDIATFIHLCCDTTVWLENLLLITPHRQNTDQSISCVNRYQLHFTIAKVCIPGLIRC